MKPAGSLRQGGPSDASLNAETAGGALNCER
jgi:hypothetical protein